MLLLNAFKRINRILITYFMVWSQNLPLIERLGVYFGSPNKSKLVGVRSNASHCYVTLSLAVVLIYGGRATAFVYFALRYGTTHVDEVAGGDDGGYVWRAFFLKAGSIYHESARLNMQMTFMLWSLNMIFMYVPQYSLPLWRLNWMAVFVMRPGGNIPPKVLGLSATSYHRLACYQRRIFQLVHYNNCFISFGAMSTEFVITFYHGLFQVDFFYRLASCLLFFGWAFSCGGPEYNSPYYIFTLTYYVKEKQAAQLDTIRAMSRRASALIRVMERQARRPSQPPGEATTSRKVHLRLLFYHKYLRLQATMLGICREAKDYTDFWRYYLTIILSTYNLTIIYKCYLIFLNALPFGFDQLYRLVFITHIFLLVVIIHSCSRVPVMIREFARECTRFHDRLLRLNILSRREVIKAQLITENIRQFEFGFRLLNDYLLDTKAYQTFLTMVTTFFFLFFRSNNII